MTKDFSPICMTEEYWANSHFSVARYYGRIRVNGHEYIILNKEGKDIFECSYEAEKAGRAKAIEPGEPADLVRSDFRMLYRKLGRDKFLEILSGSQNQPDRNIKRKMKLYIESNK